MRKHVLYLMLLVLAGLLFCDCAKKDTLAGRFVSMASDAVNDPSSVSRVQYEEMLAEYEAAYETLPNDDLDRIDEAIALCHQFFFESDSVADDSEPITYLGIEYACPEPTSDQLKAWRNQNRVFCAEWIAAQDTLSGYKIPKEMLDAHPCLVYLILRSCSIGDPKEKRDWFDTYSLMNENQMEKLYDILYRESYQLGQIGKRHEKRKQVVDGNFRAYEAARSGRFYEAFRQIDEAISHDPSNPDLYDSKGEFYLMQGRTRRALAMWNKVMALDPDFLSRHDGHTNLYDGLLELNLIK